MTIQKCENCEFYFETGVCRRFPPIPLVFPEDSQGSSSLNWNYPHVDRFDWCGEFKFKHSYGNENIIH